MKSLKHWMVGAVIALACEAQAAEPKPLATQKEKASYGVGMNLGRSFKVQAIELDTDAFMRGFKDALAGAKSAVNEEDLKAAMTAMSEEVVKKTTERTAANKKSGEDFLAKNKENKEVKTTPSGLQYIVVREGDGPSPKATETVKVHYRGTLIDGTEFDSSYERNMPAVFLVNQVIPGWTEALQKMKVGAKWKVFIPSNIAYGDQGQPPVIPPASTLVFEIELLSIEKES